MSLFCKCQTTCVDEVQHDEHNDCNVVPLLATIAAEMNQIIMESIEHISVFLCHVTMVSMPGIQHLGICSFNSWPTFIVRYIFTAKCIM